MPLTRPPETLTALRGVGPKIAEALQRLGIMHPRDLIFHLPVRYEDRTQLTTLDALRTQMPVLLEGRIVGHHVAPGRRPQAVLNLRTSPGGRAFACFTSPEPIYKPLAKPMLSDYLANPDGIKGWSSLSTQKSKCIVRHRHPLKTA